MLRYQQISSEIFTAMKTIAVLPCLPMMNDHWYFMAKTKWDIVSNQPQKNKENHGMHHQNLSPPNDPQKTHHDTFIIGTVFVFYTTNAIWVSALVCNRGFYRHI